jgi:WhiB family redox-sensing transcriptional regulator
MTAARIPARSSGWDEWGREEWRTRAACRGADPDLFFPPDEERAVARSRREAKEPAVTRSRREAKAKAICAGCPVRRECHRFAEAHDERFGIWAGVDRSDREAVA